MMAHPSFVYAPSNETGQSSFDGSFEFLDPLYLPMPALGLPFQTWTGDMAVAFDSNSDPAAGAPVYCTELTASAPGSFMSAPVPDLEAGRGVGLDSTLYGGNPLGLSPCRLMQTTHTAYRDFGCSGSSLTCPSISVDEPWDKAEPADWLGAGTLMTTPPLLGDSSAQFQNQTHMAYNDFAYSDSSLTCPSLSIDGASGEAEPADWLSAGLIDTSPSLAGSSLYFPKHVVDIPLSPATASTKASSPLGTAYLAPSPPSPAAAAAASSQQQHANPAASNEVYTRATRGTRTSRRRSRKQGEQRTQGRTPPAKTERRSLEDKILLDCRDEGMSYKRIKEAHCFEVSESTLRGRHRALTKASAQRPRKPLWKKKDVELLMEAVPKFTRISGKTKVSWKNVSEYIFQQGGSHAFAYTTCRKKWCEVTENSS